MESKRNRSANYTTGEKELLLSLVSKYKDIIENKKTDGVSLNEKIKTWDDITREFNGQAPNSIYRSVESLKKFYDNQKKTLRKRVGEERKDMYTTGGGTAKTHTDSLDDLLLSIINEKTVFGLKNPFDSNASTSIVILDSEHNHSTPADNLERPSNVGVEAVDAIGETVEAGTEEVNEDFV